MLSSLLCDVWEFDRTHAEREIEAFGSGPEPLAPDRRDLRQGVRLSETRGTRHCGLFVQLDRTARPNFEQIRSEGGSFARAWRRCPELAHRRRSGGLSE